MAASDSSKPAPTQSLAQDLFADMGKKVENMKLSSEEPEEQEQRTVEEVESMCMNCHDNVSMICDAQVATALVTDDP